MSIGWWLFMLSLRSAKISIQGPVSASYGLVTLILGIMILGEAPTLLQIMGALLVIIGAISVSLESTNLRKMSFNKDVVFAIIASISWGIAFVIMVPFAKAYPPTIAFQSHIFFSFIFSSAIVVITGKKFLPEKKIDFLPSIGLGICDSVANLAYYTAAAFFFTSLLAPLSSIYPVFTIILAYIFLKERLQKHQFLSILTILTGIMLISI
jgi:transporter family protein